VVQKRC